MTKSRFLVKITLMMAAIATLLSLNSCAEILMGMAAGMSGYNPYGYSPYGYNNSFTPSYSMGSMDYLLDPNYAIAQTQQQQAQMNNVQRQLMDVSVKQVEQQQYETYLLMTSGGTSLTYDEWKALAAQSAQENANSDYFKVMGNSNGSLSSSQYRSIYSSYESSARSYYNALTSGGVRSQDSNGNISGKTVGQMAGGTYTSAKQGLQNAQKEMRRIRLEAAQHGVTIQQSKWETATAGY